MFRMCQFELAKTIKARGIKIWNRGDFNRMFARPKSYLKPKQHFFSRNILFINERRREGRGHDPASEACRRVAGWHARAYVTREAADALHRRTTSKLIFCLHQLSSCSPAISSMMSWSCSSDRQAVERKIDIRKSSISHAIRIYLSQMLISFLQTWVSKFFTPRTKFKMKTRWMAP